LTRYIARRLIEMIPVTLLVVMMVFTVFRLVPGDPVNFLLGANPNPEAIEALRRKMGLDQPIPVQFVRWLGQAVRGDLGDSIIGQQPVVSVVLQKLPATAELAVLAILVGSIIGVPAGVISALKQDSWLDLVTRVISLFGFCTPRYWLGILLVIIFSLTLKWLPVAGYVPLANSVRDNLRHVILPAVTLALPIAAEQMRFLRSSMLEVIRQDYVLTAHAKGLRGSTVVMRHALKNALIPFLTIFGLQLGFLLGGSVVVEYVFAWPGIGWLMIQSITIRDYAVVQGGVLLAAIAFLGVNLLVDICYTFLDPRIRFD
jgi:peptide/nickel transport system permease protein